MALHYLSPADSSATAEGVHTTTWGEEAMHMTRSQASHIHTLPSWKVQPCNMHRLLFRGGKGKAARRVAALGDKYISTCWCCWGFHSVPPHCTVGASHRDHNVAPRLEGSLSLCLKIVILPLPLFHFGQLPTWPLSYTAFSALRFVLHSMPGP